MRRDEREGEILYSAELKNGLKCFVIPKKDYVEKQALIAVKYGSADRLEGAGPPPDGVAHFMEHKMFEDAELNMYDAFVKKGADVNAYTNFTLTAYYFTCADNFYENLKLLARLVRSPFFTRENVEKEKGIIAQEIDMYEDNAHWRLYMTLQKLLYGESPLSVDIAGSVRSIQDIDKDILYEYYRAFYTPSNMALICAGDVDLGEAAKICEEGFAPESFGLEGFGPDNRRRAPDTGPVCGDYAEKSMDVALPMFGIGFKDRDFGAKPPRTLSDKNAVSKILADILAGASSPLYERMYGEGVIDASFAADYAGGAFFGQSVFSGASRAPERAREMILGEVSRLKSQGVDGNRFETIKRKHIGRFTARLNAIDRIAGTQAELFTLGHSLFDLADSIANVSIDYVNERLCEHYSEENCAMAVVRPKR